MNNKKKKIVKISSMKEFRRIYLPKLRREEVLSTPEEAREYGAAIARQTLEKMRIA